MKLEIDISYGDAIKYRGQHKGIYWEVVNCGFNDKAEPLMSFAESWCSYILLSEEDHEKFKHKLSDLPWNGGYTYYRKITEKALDFERDHTHFKIGDDFQHSWDVGRSQNKESMIRHIKHVISEMLNQEVNEE